MGVDEETRLREKERERLAEEEQRRARDADQERARSDLAMVRLDESEIRARLLSAFDRFVEQGFEVHLVGVEERGSILYRLILDEDGGDAIPIAKVQGIADELRLNVFIEKGSGIVMYPRL